MNTRTARIQEAIRETLALRQKYLAHMPLPAESQLEIKRQADIAGCNAHLTKLENMLAAQL
jgi:hypothetical protein